MQGRRAGLTRLSTTVIASVLAVLLPVAAAQAQQAPALTGLGIRLAEAPTDRRDDPRAQAYIVDHVSPGTSFSREVEVINDTGGTADLELYAAPADLRGNDFSIADRGEANELTEWMALGATSARLAQAERRTVEVTIDVPADAAEGERYAAVVAELPPAGGPGQVKIATRVGIRVYLSVGAGGEPASDFVIETLTASRDAAGVPQVQALVRNTGGRALDMQGELSLAGGPGGLAAGPFPAEVGTTVAVGATAAVLVSLDADFPTGPWNARLVMRSGLLERAAEAAITFPRAAGEVGPRVLAEPVPVARDPNVVVPVAIGLLSLAFLLLLLLWRRRRKDDRDEVDAPTEPVIPTARCSPDEALHR